MEFIHRTRRPFRLIAAQIKTFSAGVTVGIEITKPLNLIRTLQLRHLPQAALRQHVFQPSVMSMTLTLSLLHTCGLTAE